MFLKLTGSHIEAEVIGKYVNQGAGYRLQLPCIYHFSSQEKAVACLSNKVTSITKEHERILSRCLDKKKKEKQKVKADTIFRFRKAISTRIYLCKSGQRNIWTRTLEDKMTKL